eukprot:666824-Hanusia_phi.AAC.1
MLVKHLQNSVINLNNANFNIDSMAERVLLLQIYPYPPPLSPSPPSLLLLLLLFPVPFSRFVGLTCWRGGALGNGEPRGGGSPVGVILRGKKRVLHDRWVHNWGEGPGRVYQIRPL